MGVSPDNSTFESRHETQQCGFRTRPKQTELCKRRRWLEAEIFYLKSRGIVTLLSMEEIIHVAKTKVLIRFAVLRLYFCICKMLVF